MKYLISFILFLITFSIHANQSTHVVLSYEFGNQITRSTLTVLSNGLVMKSESLNGKNTYLADEQLTQKDTQILQSLIEKSFLSAPLYKENLPASLGGFYGEAKIYSKNGYTSFLYTVTGNQDLNSKSMVCQEGIAADHVRKFIQDRVQVKMPLTIIPCR